MMNAIAETGPLESSRDAPPACLLQLEGWLGVPLAHWTCRSDGAWTRNRASGPASPPDRALLAAFEEACRASKPVVAACEGNGRRLVLPLPADERTVAQAGVATVAKTECDLWLRLAERSLACLEQQQELARLDQENLCFLKQVSDDFEELTFLRSVAEELALGDRPGQTTDLMRFILPLLGEAACVEGLYYFQRQPAGDPCAIETWQSQAGEAQAPAPDVLQRLVERHANAAATSPVLKNHVARSELAGEYPGIRDFLLVPVRTKLGLLGWILAINCRVRFQIAGREASAVDRRELGTTDASLIATAAAMIAAHIHNGSLLAEKESLLINIVRTLVSAVDSRDPYTCGHSERVALFAERLAAELGYDDERVQQIYLMGLLHDLGKIGVRDAVLHKPGRLTDEEFREMQRHPELGWEILRDLTQMDYVLPGVVHHHERVDGAGYPDGLTGDAIPLEGRLLAVADAYDAMTSDRPYRAGMTQEKAEQILREDEGRQWDRELVEAFLRIMPDIIAIRQQYQRPTPAPRRSPAAVPAVDVARPIGLVAESTVGSAPTLSPAPARE